MLANLENLHHGIITYTIKSTEINTVNISKTVTIIKQMDRKNH